MSILSSTSMSQPPALSFGAGQAKSLQSCRAGQRLIGVSGAVYRSENRIQDVPSGGTQTVNAPGSVRAGR
jgi:hypothetical protein